MKENKTNYTRTSKNKSEKLELKKIKLNIKDLKSTNPKLRYDPVELNLMSKYKDNKEKTT